MLAPAIPEPPSPMPSAAQVSARPEGATPDDWRMHWPESRRRSLRRWLWALALMTSAVLVVGGITRLMHAGLSMVEWQPLIGAVPPLSEADWQARFEQYQRFPQYQQLRPGIAEFKVIFLWEYLHRLLARAIGVIFLVPFVAFWWAGASR